MKMTDKPLKEVIVSLKPRTVILIPFDADETEARKKWLAKYRGLQLTEEQKRREMENVRGGKLFQRLNYNKK